MGFSKLQRFWGLWHATSPLPLLQTYKQKQWIHKSDRGEAGKKKICKTVIPVDLHYPQDK